MATTFNPGRDRPEPDDTLISDPFELMLETEGREALRLRYDYIATILEEEFEETWLELLFREHPALRGPQPRHCLLRPDARHGFSR
jgi:hypothetical protein